MIIRSAPAVRPSEITPQQLWLGRRAFLASTAALAGVAAFPARAARLEAAPGPFATDEARTKAEDAMSYNNFYELGPDKEDPKRNAKGFKSRPWSVVVDGECARPGTVPLEEFVRPHRLEERVYRLRCVEAWSMVIPWIGVPLAAVLQRFEPTSKAKYVAFTTIKAPEMMPGQRLPLLQWPYVEGLRIDEAMHPLTILAVGMYGEELPAQNGAPLRLVVPWKYGFKSIKSIVRISFVEKQPPTAWNLKAPDEYGFYSNVNPTVDHPRWSQAKERRIGDFFKRPTLPFNGYADQVAHLYAGMDLKKYF